eukprot:TRINITY_DN37387_c0_g1_i1.p1 TRINITY_DN37387_c0_g1~~TRINITY_DN37387_c0_g1_i1.p1  ORF type:complete len:326 (+),score=38.14 TRINITY_DN37387_c0_g1_i1:113-1090(+)
MLGLFAKDLFDAHLVLDSGRHGRSSAGADCTLPRLRSASAASGQTGSLATGGCPQRVVTSAGSMTSPSPSRPSRASLPASREGRPLARPSLHALTTRRTFSVPVEGCRKQAVALAAGAAGSAALGLGGLEVEKAGGASHCGRAGAASLLLTTPRPLADAGGGRQAHDMSESGRPALASPVGGGGRPCLRAPRHSAPAVVANSNAHAPAPPHRPPRLPAAARAETPVTRSALDREGSSTPQDPCIVGAGRRAEDLESPTLERPNSDRDAETSSILRAQDIQDPNGGGSAARSRSRPKRVSFAEGCKPPPPSSLLSILHDARCEMLE